MTSNRMLTFVPLLAAMLLALPATGRGAEEATAAAAGELARKGLITDTHIDVPYRLHENWADVTRATEDGDFDYERARAGGLDLPFMSIYTPAESEAEGTSYDIANRLIDSVEALVGRAPDRFVIVRNPDEAEQAFRGGKIGLAMGMKPVGGNYKIPGVFMPVYHGAQRLLSTVGIDPDPA